MPDTNDKSSVRRSVRSFVRRAGRITVAQKKALTDLWPSYGIPHTPGIIDFDRCFGRTAPRIVEIGFGNGEALVAAAMAHPEYDFVGIEVHEPGVGHCMLRVHDASLTNVRIISHDAVEVLKEQIADGALAGINLYFPDPWPKKRHHKRRIVQSDFAALIASKLAPDGQFHVATDWAPYAGHIDDVISSSGFFAPLRDAAKRPKTKFERRGERLGHEIWERIFTRI
jgi:tRNA (guanine-N7-)-methyltransferase